MLSWARLGFSTVCVTPTEAKSVKALHWMFETQPRQDISHWPQVGPLPCCAHRVGFESLLGTAPARAAEKPVFPCPHPGGQSVLVVCERSLK